MDLWAICQNLYLPWLLYSAVSAVMSFHIHFKYPKVAYLIAVLCLAAVLATAFPAFRSISRSGTIDQGRDRKNGTWYVFLFVAASLAWVLGMIVGVQNFRNNLQPFYEIAVLNRYPAVDPNRIKGQQIMDGGRVIFLNNAVLDLKRSMGFKNKDTYCVAPITFAEEGVAQPLVSYDYWAVGTNCCSGNMNDYKCGDYANLHAHSGLRAMGDEDRQFYRLAVQQAESRYEIKATHPLFFVWQQDADDGLNKYLQKGYKWYTLGITCHFLFSVLAVFVVATHFGKRDGIF
jgi:hypothetical protein